MGPGDERRHAGQSRPWRRHLWQQTADHIDPRKSLPGATIDALSIWEGLPMGEFQELIQSLRDDRLDDLLADEMGVLSLREVVELLRRVRTELEAGQTLAPDEITTNEITSASAIQRSRARSPDRTLARVCRHSLPRAPPPRHGRGARGTSCLRRGQPRPPPGARRRCPRRRCRGAPGRSGRGRPPRELAQRVGAPRLQQAGAGDPDGLLDGAVGEHGPQPYDGARRRTCPPGERRAVHRREQRPGRVRQAVSSPASAAARAGRVSESVTSPSCTPQVLTRPRATAPAERLSRAGCPRRWSAGRRRSRSWRRRTTPGGA